MNQINVTRSNPVTKVKGVLINKLIARLKAATCSFLKSVHAMPSQLWEFLKRKNYEAAMIEQRSMEQMEKRYGPNWISMRGIY